MRLVYRRTIRIALLAAALSMSCLTPARSQALRLVQHGTGSAVIEALVGDTLHLDLVADLGSMSVAGLSLYVRVPRDGFEIVDLATAAQTSVRPFLPGDLMLGAVEIRNAVLQDEPGQPVDDCLLSFAALVGPSSDRTLSGVGTIAGIRLQCRSPVSSARISLHSNPIHESRIVLADGRSEIPLPPSPGVDVDVVAQTSISPGPSWGQLKADTGPARP